jgi:hypothetical protein
VTPDDTIIDQIEEAARTSVNIMAVRVEHHMNTRQQPAEQQPLFAPWLLDLRLNV